MLIETKDLIVEFEDSQKTKELVFQKLVQWYKKHESFSGECIMQSDDPQIEAAPLLAELADDIFKFKVTYKD